MPPWLRQEVEGEGDEAGLRTFCRPFGGEDREACEGGEDRDRVDLGDGAGIRLAEDGLGSPAGVYAHPLEHGGGDAGDDGAPGFPCVVRGDVFEEKGAIEVELWGVGQGLAVPLDCPHVDREGAAGPGFEGAEPRDLVEPALGDEGERGADLAHPIQAEGGDEAEEGEGEAGVGGSVPGAHPLFRGIEVGGVERGGFGEPIRGEGGGERSVFHTWSVTRLEQPFSLLGELFWF